MLKLLVLLIFTIGFTWLIVSKTLSALFNLGKSRKNHLNKKPEEKDHD